MQSDFSRPSTVKLHTSMGQIECELYWYHAPKTCKNFLELTRRGYYDNTKFHRVVANFMLQTGDPTGTGRGGSSIYGPHFEDEIHKELKHTGAGILSMANSGPNTNGSQFFITLAPAKWLDDKVIPLVNLGKHAIFGRIKGGMENVKRLGQVPTDNNDRPLQDIYIIKATPVDQP